MQEATDIRGDMATLSTDAIPIEHVEEMPSGREADTTVHHDACADDDATDATARSHHDACADDDATDATARKVYERGNTPESHRIRHTEQLLHIPAPHIDWEFNKLLLDVAKNIDDMGGLQDMKDMFLGQIGLTLLEEIRCARDLFHILRTRMIVTRYNIVHLQALLRILNRPALDQLAIDFSRRMGNVIHFFPASAEPLNGYRHIQVHVDGTDFTTCTRTFIQDLKSTISTLLFLPPRDVLIAGIEPSSSLIITIMIPETHVVYLIEMANTSIPELTKLGVDIFKIDDTTYNLHGVDDAELVETEQQRKLVTVYNQLAEKTRQLEERDIECLKLQRELELHGVDDAELVETEQQRKLVTVYNQLAEKTRQLEERDIERLKLQKESELHGEDDAELVETEQQRKLVTVYNQLAEKTRQLDERDIECPKLQRELEMHGVDDAELVETEQQRKLVTVYNQLAEKTRQLDESDIECLKLQRELELYKSSNDLNAYILGASAYDYYVIQQQRSTVRNGIQLHNVSSLAKQCAIQLHNVSSLAKQSALSYFRFLLAFALLLLFAFVFEYYHQ